MVSKLKENYCLEKEFRLDNVFRIYFSESVLSTIFDINNGRNEANFLVDLIKNNGRLHGIVVNKPLGFSKFDCDFVWFSANSRKVINFNWFRGQINNVNIAKIRRILEKHFHIKSFTVSRIIQETLNLEFKCSYGYINYNLVFGRYFKNIEHVSNSRKDIKNYRVFCKINKIKFFYLQLIRNKDISINKLKRIAFNLSLYINRCTSDYACYTYMAGKSVYLILVDIDRFLNSIVRFILNNYISFYKLFNIFNFIDLKKLMIVCRTLGSVRKVRIASFQEFYFWKELYDIYHSLSNLSV